VRVTPLSALDRALARKKEPAPAGGATPTSAAATSEAPAARRAVVCLACGHPITHVDAAISVAGSPVHTFMNPGGYVFEIACYREAPGTVAAGPPSAEWSWFPGHLWQIALCAACRCHVGWGFTAEGAHFFGLVRDRIGEAEG
jgi:hypothetical protein